MSDNTSPQSDVPLSDVMLAMDVVDMLRHEDKLVARALDVKAREQRLVERVKNAYAAQGIAVSDEMIESGVAALKEKEYSYEPAAPGFKTRLLMAWVNRRSIGGGLGAIAVLAGIIGGGWYGFVEYPQHRAQAEVVETLNNTAVLQNTDIDELVARRGLLTRRWQTLKDNEPEGELGIAFEQMSNTIDNTLARAGNALETAVTLQQAPSLSDDISEARRSVFRDKLKRQQTSINAARQLLAESETAIAAIDKLEQLPATLSLLRSEALDLAVPAEVDRNIEQLYQMANSALKRGDISAASNGAEELRSLIGQLERAFRLRIVSRPGELSGVIREPPNNQRASNYYLIVEALDSAGQSVRVNIESEEDGSSATVSRWGIRVNENVFDQIKRDKQDDGIIQQSGAGEKRRGYLDIDYSLPTTGGMIHRWETP